MLVFFVVAEIVNVVFGAVAGIGGGFKAHAREATGEQGREMELAIYIVLFVGAVCPEVDVACAAVVVLGGRGEDVGIGGIIVMVTTLVIVTVSVVVASDEGAGAGGARGGDFAATGIRDAVSGLMVHEIALTSEEKVVGIVIGTGSATTSGGVNVGADEVEVVGGGEVGFDIGGVAAVLVGLDDEMEVMVVGGLVAKEEGIGEDLVGAGIGGFGEGGEAEEGLLEVLTRVGVVAGVADIVGIHIAGGVKAEVVIGKIEAVVAAEGVIDDGGVVAFVDYVARVGSSVKQVIRRVFAGIGEIEEVGEEVVVGVFGGFDGGVGCGVEAEEVAMEVMVANNGTLVVGAVVRVGEEHLGEGIGASGAGGGDGAEAAIGADGEVVANAVVGAVAEEIQAEDVIGDGGGDGGIDFAIGLHIAKSGAGEELGFKEGEGGDYFFEAIAGDGASSGVSGELVDEVKIDVSEVARGVIEGGLGGASDAAVVETVEGCVHFEELGGLGGEGGEVAAASIDGDGGRVDADGEDEAILVDGGEGGGAGVLGGDVTGIQAWAYVVATGSYYCNIGAANASGDVGIVNGGYFAIDVFVDGEVVAFDFIGGEVVQEDVIKEAGIDGIDEAGGEDGGVFTSIIEIDSKAVGDIVPEASTDAAVEVGEDLGEGDGKVFLPGIVEVIAGVEVEVDVVVLV